MGKINMARVVLGGLVAGVVVNLFEFVANGIILDPDWRAAMTALGRQMPSGVAGFVVWGFLMGLGVIWLYAVARPRFGPGTKTAAIVALGYWIFAYAVPNFGTGVLGLFPNRLLVISTLVGLVELIAASLAGASLYKEPV